jgi:hypothetical protein
MLFQRATCFVPTWRGWLLLFVAVTLGVIVLGTTLYPFLAPIDEAQADVWVVEGWMSDSGLRQVAGDLRVRQARSVFVIGGKLDKGSALIAHRTHARVGAMTLVALGLDPKRVHVVEPPDVVRDRTFTSMLALRACLQRSAVSAGDILLASPGPHARRSRMLLARALARPWVVYVSAIPDNSYDTRAWWRSNEGFRTVIGEWIAYMHALIFARGPGELEQNAAITCETVER